MSEGVRLWRTDDGDLVEEGHPDAVILAYGEDDILSDEDAARVREGRKQAPKAADKQAPAPRNKRRG